jgi:sulfoxide reductase heme-binding subunit YedZ
MPQLLKPAVFLASLLPLAQIAVAVPQLVEPIEYIVSRTGIWSIGFLCMALAVTPLRKLLRLPALAAVRGMVGLFAFFYASLHVLSVVWIELGFDWTETWHIVTLRPTNTLDAIAYLMLVPLAATSTRRAKQFLGARRWILLHRLAYVIAPLAAARFWASALEGRGFAPAIGITLVLALLLGIRLYWRVQATYFRASPPKFLTVFARTFRNRRVL